MFDIMFVWVHSLHENIYITEKIYFRAYRKTIKE